MKKLLVKIKVIDTPYSPLMPAIPEKWIKAIDGEVVTVFEQPLEKVMVYESQKWVKDEEVSYTIPEDAENWVYHPQSEREEMLPDESWEHQPFVPEIPEQQEESHIEIIAQTQGSDEELAIWLEGDKHKYPEGHWVEYEDISAQVYQERVNEIALQYLASTDWLIIREIDAGIPCPSEIKIERQLARERIVK